MTAPQLTLIAIPGIPLIQPGDDLAAIILQRLTDANLNLHHGDVLVVAQKIVSKAEGRLLPLDSVQPSNRSLSLAAETGKDPKLVEVILRDSREVVRHRRGVLIVEQRNGFVCANAGVDHSNVPARDGRPQVALLPADADASAARLRAQLRDATGKDVAVIINDSHGRPFRLGTCGVAIGVAGMAPLSDRRGTPDLFGQPLRITTVGTADELAAAASALMGQGAEGQPVVLIRGAAFDPAPGTVRDLLRPREADLFREPVPPSAVTNLLYRRQSVRHYAHRPVDRNTLEELIAAACAAPSAHNRQHWRFAVVTKQAVKARLARAMGESFRQDMRREGLPLHEIETRAGRSYHRLVDSPALILAGYSTSDAGSPVAGGQQPLNAAPPSKIEETMAIQSVAAAIENLLLAATAFGLGACWVCWPLFCPDVVREALRLPADFQAQALITVGYPAEAPPRRERFPLETRAFWFLEEGA
ncbi:MAG: coenzyme F420-0:L-glutamate ligase [Chloroflexi bacterium]|nr:coenzyme F420-0:L-glutamate ligase [Chloroflexota bacterium]